MCSILRISVVDVWGGVRGGVSACGLYCDYKWRDAITRRSALMPRWHSVPPTQSGL